MESNGEKQQTAQPAAQYLASISDIVMLCNEANARRIAAVAAFRSGQKTHRQGPGGVVSEVAPAELLADAKQLELRAMNAFFEASMHIALAAIRAVVAGGDEMQLITADQGNKLEFGVGTGPKGELQ